MGKTYFSPADVEMFKNFSLPIAKDKRGGRVNLWKVKKISRKTKRELEREEREQRIAALAEHYQNPDNFVVNNMGEWVDGKSFFEDTIFEQVEENRPIHLNANLVKALSQINDE